MKNILLSFPLLASVLVSAQVIVGNDVGTVLDDRKTNVLLEFAAAQNKGIILPYLRIQPANASPGTFAVDARTPDKAKVVFRNNTTWLDLSSGFTADLSTVLGNQPAGNSTTVQKSVIGSTTSAADGLLVLESTTKAMVLPRVVSTVDVINPAPGMMVYVNNPSGKRLAVYNGQGWTYWKAK